MLGYKFFHLLKKYNMNCNKLLMLTIFCICNMVYIVYKIVDNDFAVLNISSVHLNEISVNEYVYTFNDISKVIFNLNKLLFSVLQQ